MVAPPVVRSKRGVGRGAKSAYAFDISSQYLSGLLMAAAAAGRAVEISLEGPLVSVPYATMTVGLLEQWNVRVEALENRRFLVPVGQSLWPSPNGFIEPDASAASYFWGAAAITAGRVQGRRSGHSLVSQE